MSIPFGDGRKLVGTAGPPAPRTVPLPPAQRHGRWQGSTGTDDLQLRATAVCARCTAHAEFLRFRLARGQSGPRDVQETLASYGTVWTFRLEERRRFVCATHSQPASAGERRLPAQSHIRSWVKAVLRRFAKGRRHRRPPVAPGVRRQRSCLKSRGGALLAPGGNICLQKNNFTDSVRSDKK
jgi:hypothetical protein